MGDAEKRKRLRAHYRACDRVRELNEAIEREHVRLVPRWVAWGAVPMPVLRLLHCPPFPADLQGMTCGARTRAGGACKITAIFRSGRCKLHGGLSSGPRTPQGKARAASNGNAPKRKRSP